MDYYLLGYCSIIVWNILAWITHMLLHIHLVVTNTTVYSDK